MRHEVSYGIVLLVSHETRPVSLIAVPYVVMLYLARSQIAVFGCQFRGAEAPAHGMEALRAGANQSVLTDFHVLRKDFPGIERRYNPRHLRRTQVQVSGASGRQAVRQAHTGYPRRERAGHTQTVGWLVVDFIPIKNLRLARGESPWSTCDCSWKFTVPSTFTL